MANDKEAFVSSVSKKVVAGVIAGIIVILLAGGTSALFWLYSSYQEAKKANFELRDTLSDAKQQIRRQAAETVSDIKQQVNGNSKGLGTEDDSIFAKDEDRILSKEELFSQLTTTLGPAFQKIAEYNKINYQTAKELQRLVTEKMSQVIEVEREKSSVLSRELNHVKEESGNLKAKIDNYKKSHEEKNAEIRILKAELEKVKKLNSNFYALQNKTYEVAYNFGKAYLKALKSDTTLENTGKMLKTLLTFDWVSNSDARSEKEKIDTTLNQIQSEMDELEFYYKTVQDKNYIN